MWWITGLHRTASYLKGATLGQEWVVTVHSWIDVETKYYQNDLQGILRDPFYYFVIEIVF